MNASAPEIRPFRPEHADEVGGIFLRELGRSFVGGLGKEFLKQVYFPFLLERFGDLQLVSLSSGRVTGFLLGGRAEGVHGAILRSHPAAFLAAAVKGVVRKPSYLRKIIEVAVIMTIGPRSEDDEASGAVLFLAVDGSQQRTGAGTALLDWFETALRNAGYRRCIVDTMLNSPDAQRFYERRGYQEIKRGWGRVWYQKSL